jgi:hypothetical protein
MTYAAMLDLLIIMYVQFMIMLTELKTVLSHELQSLFEQQDYQSPIRMNCTKNYGCKSYILIALEIHYTEMYVYYIEMYILYVQYVCTLEVHMPTSDIVIPYIR